MKATSEFFVDGIQSFQAGCCYVWNNVWKCDKWKFKFSLLYKFDSLGKHNFLSQISILISLMLVQQP